MATWLVILIVVGVVLITGGLAYVVYCRGRKNVALTTALVGASAILNVLESVFNDESDLGAYGFIVALGALAVVCLEALESAEAGIAFEDLKVSMVVQVRTIVDTFPDMGGKVSDGDIEKAVDAFFMVVRYTHISVR